MKKYAGEIEQYESATKYLKDHLNGYGKIPEKAWWAEQDALQPRDTGFVMNTIS